MEIKFKSTIDVTEIQAMGGDHMVVAAAKVSTCGNDAMQYAIDMQEFMSNPTGVLMKKRDDNYGLINYLMKHRHGTPFEHGSVTFFVHAPIFVWREWHRHRIGFSYNEESGRYKQLEPVFYLPDRNRPMMCIDGWKPGKPKFRTLDQHFNADIQDSALKEAGRKYEADQFFQQFCNRKKAQYSTAYKSYEQSLAEGVDPGLARIDLPVGIYSGCWVTCNPRSLMAFLSLRTHEPEKATFVSYPLWEIELAARSCEEILKKIWPLTYQAFCENGRVGP